MSSADVPSERLIEQRLRNLVMDALVALSEGDEGVRSVGHVEYAEQFFDMIDDDSPMGWRGWTCFTADEVRALDTVRRLLAEACMSTPGVRTDQAFIESGWPARIQPNAADALALMRARGRFSDDAEEDLPSRPG